MFVKISVVPIEVTIVERIKDSIELIKKDIELVDTLPTSNKVKPFEFLSTSLPLTPLQIGVRPKITLIFSTFHALEVFTMPIITFDKTPNQWKVVEGISIQD